MLSPLAACGMEGTVKWMWMLRDTQWKTKTNQPQIDRLRTEQREDRACLRLLTNCCASKSVYGAQHTTPQAG
jgi:hypothetical protein